MAVGGEKAGARPVCSPTEEQEHLQRNTTSEGGGETNPSFVFDFQEHLQRSLKRTKDRSGLRPLTTRWNSKSTRTG